MGGEGGGEAARAPDGWSRRSDSNPNEFGERAGWGLDAVWGNSGGIWWDLGFGFGGAGEAGGGGEEHGEEEGGGGFADGPPE